MNAAEDGLTSVNSGVRTAGMGRVRRAARALRWLCLACCCGFALAQAASDRSVAVEYRIKASLVFNFMHFIEWPDDAFGDSGQFNVCLVGRDVYGDALRMLEREVVQGKTLAVKTYGLWYPVLAASCQVIIFGGQSREAEQEGLAMLAGKSVLSIGESPEFLSDGGIIRFAIIDDSVRFEVNQETARRARLNISSKLLRLATNVVTYDPARTQ